MDGLSISDKVQDSSIVVLGLLNSKLTDLDTPKYNSIPGLH